MTERYVSDRETQERDAAVSKREQGQRIYRFSDQRIQNQRC